MRKLGIALFFIIYVLIALFLMPDKAEAGVIIVVALAAFFFTYIKWPSKEKETSRTPEEDYKYRRRKLKTKIILSIIFYIYSCIGCLLFTHTEGLASILFGLTGSISCFVAIFMFSSTLHDPLTPMEADELKRAESIEKTGVQPSIESSTATVDSPVETVSITEKIKVSKKEILNSFVKYEIDSYKSSIGIRVIGSIWAGIWLLSAIFVMTNSGPDSIYLALGFFVIGFLPILFIIRSMIKHKKRVKEIKAEELYFKREIVDRKEIKTEKITYSDAPDELVTSYLVTLIPSEMRISVSEKKFNELNKGDILITVYRGENKGVAKWYQDTLYELVD